MHEVNQPTRTTLFARARNLDITSLGVAHFWLTAIFHILSHGWIGLDVRINICQYGGSTANNTKYMQIYRRALGVLFSIVCSLHEVISKKGDRFKWYGVDKISCTYFWHLTGKCDIDLACTNLGLAWDMPTQYLSYFNFLKLGLFTLTTGKLLGRDPAIISGWVLRTIHQFSMVWSYPKTGQSVIKT